MIVRLHKYLADKGVASRRACEEFIRKGLVKVNGFVVTEMGVKVDPEKDVIETDPSLKLITQKYVYYLVHKPVGYVCTVTGSEGPRVTELLTVPERVFPVGRLDKLTAGLLVLTNDGRFAYQLTHPKFEKEKEYVVKVREKVGSEAIKILSEPFFIEGRKTQPATIKVQSPHLFHVILREGRNRQIRRMCMRAELHIEKLKRIRVGKLLLGALEPGEYRPLTKAERELLLS